MLVILQARITSVISVFSNVTQQAPVEGSGLCKQCARDAFDVTLVGT